MLFEARSNRIETRFEYVRLFEQADNLLLNTWIVIRIDGRGFTKQDALGSASCLLRTVLTNSADSPQSTAGRSQMTRGRWI